MRVFLKDIKKSNNVKIKGWIEKVFSKGIILRDASGHFYIDNIFVAENNLGIGDFIEIYGDFVKNKGKISATAKDVNIITKFPEDKKDFINVSKFDDDKYYRNRYLILRQHRMQKNIELARNFRLMKRIWQQ